MMLKFGESRHPVFRSTSPLSRGVLKSKGGGKLSIHLCADEGTIETVFRTIISVNQLSIYGAVSDLREECKSRPCWNRETCFDGTIWPIVCAEKFVDENIYTFDWWSCAIRSIAKVPRTSGQVVTTKSCDWILYWCRIPDNGWCRTVLHDKRHWRNSPQFTESVACREYTLPRDETLSDPTGWIRGNTKIGPVLEVTTSYLQGQYGVEIRIESLIKDNSHSWVRISHGLNQLVTYLIDKEYDDNEQETSETKTEAFALKTDVLAVASRSKAEAKPLRRTPAGSSTRILLIGWKKEDWCWSRKLFVYRLPSVKTAEYSSSSWKPTSRQWWSDWILENKGISSERSSAISTLVWWKVEEYNGKRGGNKKRFFNIVLIHQDKKFFISQLFKVIQDAISLMLHYRTMY